MAAPRLVNVTDRLVRIGAAVFAVGFVAMIADVVPFFFGAENRPTWLNVLAIGGVVLGLGCALTGLALAVRSPAPIDPDLESWVGIPDAPAGQESSPDSAG